MRWLVIDSSNTGDQRSPGILAPDALQPFLRRCRLLGQFDDVANRIIIDIGIDRLRRPAIAAVENWRWAAIMAMRSRVIAGTRIAVEDLWKTVARRYRGWGHDHAGRQLMKASST